jgi:coatomer protein complex subunit gamma
MSKVEATDVFFGVTKLFIIDEPCLRRLVYLFIKDVAETCNQDDVIIVISCLTKDMTCGVDMYSANALRVLVRILDAAMLRVLERYIKRAIVDSSGRVSSSALVSASHFFLASPECAAVVTRWFPGIEKATQSPNEMVQFHAIQLLYQIKSQNRLEVSKLVSQFNTRNTLRSPLALVLLVRYTGKLLADENAKGCGSISNGSLVTKQGYQFLQASLYHHSELVVYEAARAICSIDNIEPQDLPPVVSVLRLFLKSPKPAVRFAAMRTLAQVANTQPRIVSKCNEDLEALVGDANRSIATMAIDTLLKTGTMDVGVPSMENGTERFCSKVP